MKLRAALSITHPSGRDYDGVSIRIEDRTSLTEFLEINISHQEFSKALGHLQSRPTIDCEVRGLDKIGKKRIVDHFDMVFNDALPPLWGKDREAAEHLLIKEAKSRGFGDNGWIVSAYTALHSRNGYFRDKEGNTIYRMTRTKYVEISEEERLTEKSGYDE